MQTYRKQRVWRVAGVCLLAVLLLLGAGRRTEAAAPVADTFDISLTYGYDNSVKYNRDAAFHVQVTSKDADFSGKVHLLTSAYRQDVYYGSGSLMSLPFGHRAYALSYDNYGVSKVLELDSDIYTAHDRMRPFCKNSAHRGGRTDTGGEGLFPVSAHLLRRVSGGGADR